MSSDGSLRRVGALLRHLTASSEPPQCGAHAGIAGAGAGAAAGAAVAAGRADDVGAEDPCAVAVETMRSERSKAYVRMCERV